MDIKNTISTTEARNNFSEVIDKVEKTGAHYTLTVNGRPKVVMMGAEEFESWQETLEIMSDPALAERLRKALKEPYRPEDYVSLDKLTAEEKTWPK